ncbi:serine hydrolase domain-containing protein [Aegicerativicinus sediminis]
MKFLRTLFKWVIAPITILLILLYAFKLDYLLKAINTIYFNGHTTAFLDDYKQFDNHIIEDGTAQPWPIHSGYNSKNTTENLQKLNDKFGTIAFMIIKNDSIWFEEYYDGYTKDSHTNSFSMAKSMVSAMLGRAIMEDKIKSLEEPVGNYFSEFNNGIAADLTVGDLSSMASGLNWDESYYSPFSITTRAYFDNNLKELMLGVKVVEEPGKRHEYLSGNTELLGMVISKATGKSLSEYLSATFWQPMGAEHQAFWQIDSEENGMEKAYCCIASNARDFARFGKLYKDHGKWKGQSLLDSSFISKSITPRFKESPQYGYGWWLLDHNKKKFFMMWGHLGQYIIVNPKDNIIIVRLGHKSSDDVDDTHPFNSDIYSYIDEAYNILTK